MNKLQLSYLLGLSALVLISLGLVSGYALCVWLTASQPDQVSISNIISTQQGLLPLGLLLVLFLGVGFLLHRNFQAYFFTVKRLAEEMKLILNANPEHRVTIEGPAEVRDLAGTINTFADQFQTLLTDDEEKMNQARAAIETERNRLAALMSELSEGVLVCNLEGRILLYNNRAKQLLSRDPEHYANGNGTTGFVGLGRSVFGLVDRDSITHALDEISYRQEKQGAQLASTFVTTAASGQLIRVRLTPIYNPQNESDGFVLTLEDITQQLEVSARRDVLLKSLSEGMRASLANIRAAIETIEEFPDMEEEQRGQFRKVIQDEAQTLSHRLNETLEDHAADLRTNWQLEQMLGSNLLWAICRRFEDKLQIYTEVEAEEENLWLNVDSYSVVQAMTYIMRRLKNDFNVREVSFRLKRTGRIAALDMIWTDAPIDTETLWEWQEQTSIADGEGFPLPLKEVVERHGGEIWCQTDQETGAAYLRLLLPVAQPKPSWNIPIVQMESRPEYYDFDLFHQPGQVPELDHQPLTDLTYTVFDTETTGLNPSEGDEIISISAVRIVNGRLLRQEVFDQLIDPRRPISRQSTEIHGISPDMLQGQPFIEQVLPQFGEFAEDTVLVAHNAAFDMKLLQLKEEKLGVKFINPVLDTLLLAAVVHPNQEIHSLEAIAQRFGINIIGRHSSLGDAMVTGEIFLKLIPLLAEQGIYTLKQARTAAEKTYYARLSY